MVSAHGPTLASPLALPSGVELPNRLMKSAMTEGLADSDDLATPELVTLYRRWSAGGAGLCVTGNVMVDRRYLERPGNVCIDGPQSRDAMRRLEAWAQAGTTAGNHLWLQINHPGRQCTRMSSSRPVAPSAVQLRLGGMFARPRALEEDEIVDIIRRFSHVASVAKAAGFTGVQIHSAHGYLSSQFLSPRVNRRTDRWGGPLENRARFLLEAVRAVRRTVGPGFPLGVKLNSSDFQQGAYTLDDCCRVAEWLSNEGIDLLEISGGTYEQFRLLGVGGNPQTARDEPLRESTRRREAYFVDYARVVRGATTVPLAVTGGFRTRAAMTGALSAGDLDVVGLARPLCTEPDLPRRLLDGSAETARADEDTLRLGRGILGPNSRNNFLRGLNVQAQVGWFYRQIIHLARGEPVELDLSARRALTTHFTRELRVARARRRRHAGLV